MRKLSWPSLPRLGVAALPLACVLAGAAPAHALTMKECSASTQQSKKDGSLNGADWRTFRTTQCGAEATPAAERPPSATTAGSAPAAAAAGAPSETRAAPAAAATSSPAAQSPSAPSGPAVFPNAVAPKYVNEKPGQARLHTCLDQYKVNKAGNANGGMHWIQKGGGYYSQCAKHLKGVA